MSQELNPQGLEMNELFEMLFQNKHFLNCKYKFKILILNLFVFSAWRPSDKKAGHDKSRKIPSHPGETKVARNVIRQENRSQFLVAEPENSGSSDKAEKHEV